jgi:thioredoxin reductase (NADPH)
MLRWMESSIPPPATTAATATSSTSPSATAAAWRPAEARTEDAPITETADLHGAFPRLTQAQINLLSSPGRRRRIEPDDVLYREGDELHDFIVVLDGLVAVMEGAGIDERLVAIHGPRRFLGELGLVTGQPSFVSAIARTSGEVLIVPVDELRALVANDAALGDVVLRAFLLRRSLLIELGVGIRIIGSRHSPDTRRLREFAARNRLPHRWIDLEEDNDAEMLVQRLGIAPDDTPIVIWRGDRVLRNPSNAELAQVIGLRPVDVPQTTFDVVVVGAGPSGLAAAVYGAADGLSVVAIEGIATGGQAGSSPRIENYLGFPSGVSGQELADRAVLQAKKFGAEMRVPAVAIGLQTGGGEHHVLLDDGHEIVGRTVLLATGVRYRKLDVERLDEFKSSGVYYAATLVEGQQCRGQDVVVVGGGNTAGQAAISLSGQVRGVHLLAREDDLTQNMSRYLVERLTRIPSIDVHPHTEPRALEGDDTVRAVVVEDTRTGERRRIHAEAIFVFIGAEPHTRWLGDHVALDENGYILTGVGAAASSRNRELRDVERRQGFLETSCAGIFAAGDVRSGAVKRVSAAVGEGAMGVRLASSHLAAEHGATSR